MRKLTTLFYSLLFALILSAQPAQAATYNIDQDHSSVDFKVKHLFSWVRGNFNTFEGVINYDPEKPESWSVEATIDVASIDTRVAERDKHLRNKDFFDVETYPSISFKSTKVTDVDGDEAKLHGVLSMHGVEKEVVMDLEIHGIGNDPWGNTLAGFSASTEIERKDFGIVWNKTLDNGGLLLGETVKITIDVEAMQQA